MLLLLPATDNFGRPFEPTGLTLNVAALDNAEIPQNSYALIFTDGLANTLVTVELASEGDAGSIELSVSSGDIQSAASITLNPFPPVLASITLAAVDSSLVQTTAGTAVPAELILTALDNYGDPVTATVIVLQTSASNDAEVLPSAPTISLASSSTGGVVIDILPENDLDTTVTVSIERGNLDPAVQLLPDGGIQITVRALRVLRQLQLSLTGREPPLQQVDRLVPISENIRLIGLDQYGQPIAFPEVMLTAAADPPTTQVTLEPQQVGSMRPEGALIVLEVSFPDPLATMLTIAIANPGTGITANELVVQALPDFRDSIQPLNVDDTDTRVTELDLLVALRWLEEPQSSTASLVVNLTLGSANITAAGIENLRQLFNENSDRVDLNRDGRADHLDLRILLRYMSGLRDTELAEQDVFEAVIRLLLGNPP